MKNRFFLATICIIAFPLLFELFQSENINNSTPFAGVALAGRTTVGAWCECGVTDCICDPGETPHEIKRHRRTDNNESSDEPIAEPGTDVGSIALIIAFMALTLFRLRP